MNQWDIFLYPFLVERPHPVVVLSNDDRCRNPDLEDVNVLMCASIRSNRPLRNSEIVLNGADGLDWSTAVRCDVIYLVPKANFRELRGRVSATRRAVIARKICDCLRLPRP